MPAPGSPRRGSASRTSAPSWLFCLILGLGTLAVYWPVLYCDSVNFDDPYYFSENPQVQAGLTVNGLAWAFQTTLNGNWHPLTWLSLMTDCCVFGLSAGALHATNLLLHVANTILFFLVLREFTGARWRSAIVAAFFAWHPLHVESVAWLAERKDVLSTFFGCLSLWAYGRYARRREAGASRTAGFYALALVTFAFGLMSKPMLVTWPLLFLLLDYWPLRRRETAGPRPFLSGLRCLLWEKLPFLALSAGCAVITLLAQKHSNAVQSLTDLPLAERLGNAAVSYVRYLGKTFWPADLCAFYPVRHWAAWQVWGAVVLLGAISAPSLWLARRLPFLATGWLWFLGTLLPVIGLVQVGEQAMADRYAYVPLVGLFLGVTWGVARLVARRRGLSAASVAFAGLLLLACSWQSRRQLAYWQNSGTLFERALSQTTNNYFACNMLGLWFYHNQQAPRAIENYLKALAIAPAYADAHNNLGAAFASLGSLEQATNQYALALQFNPHSDEAHNNLGVALASLGALDEAVTHYLRAIELNPENAESHNALGNALRRQGRPDEAIAHYYAALRIRPRFAEASYNLGTALARQGRLEDAIERFRQALEVAPGFAQAHGSLGAALARSGRRQEALSELTEALRLNPELEEAKRLLQALQRPDK